MWISLLNTFSTGDQSLVLILSKRTVLVRKCLENSNFLLNAGTGHSGVVSTVMGLCPLLWAVFCPLPGLPWLMTLSNGFSACILGLHTTFSQIKKMLFLANRPNTNHPGLPSFSSRGLLKPGGFIECIQFPAEVLCVFQSHWEATYQKTTLKKTTEQQWVRLLIPKHGYKRAQNWDAKLDWCQSPVLVLM